jgi:hypothetical protein
MKKFTMWFRLSIMFDVMDTRKEEYISLEETKTFSYIGPKMIEAKTMCALELLDTAKDKKINRAEFTTACG